MLKVTNNAVLYGDVEEKGKKCELFALPVGSNGQITAWVAGNVKVYSNQTAVYAVFAKKRASSCKGFLTQALKASALEKLLVLSKSAETAAKNAEAAAESAEAVVAADLAAGVATAEEVAGNVAVAKEAAETARRLATEVLKLALKAQATTEEADVTPIEEADEAPVEEADEAPVEETTEAPAEETTEETTEAPAEEVVEVPAEETTEASAEEVSEAPAEETTEAPAEEAVEAPAEETTEAPAEEVAEAPAEETTEAPAEEVAEASDEETTEASVEEVDEVAAKAKEIGLEEIPSNTGLRTFKGSRYTYVYLPNSRVFFSMSHTGKKGGSPELFELIVAKVAPGARVPKAEELAEAEKLGIEIDFTYQLCVDSEGYRTYKGEQIFIRPARAVYNLVSSISIDV